MTYNSRLESDRGPLAVLAGPRLLSRSVMRLSGDVDLA
jgi:hypothetical protein